MGQDGRKREVEKTERRGGGRTKRERKRGRGEREIGRGEKKRRERLLKYIKSLILR